MSENSDLNKEKAMQEPLLLISGFAANEKAWSHQIEHLKEICNIQVIIMDRQLSRQQMVDHILSTAPKKFSLAGQSMGGWIAQAVAAEAGNQIDRLILLNTWCSSDPKLNEVEYQLMTALEHGEIEKIFSQHLPLILHSDHLHDAKILGAIQTMFMSFPIATLIHQLHAIMTDYESLPLLSKIEAKTLIIHGQQDALFPLSEQQQLHSHIKHSKLAFIEECGHCSTLEQPEAVTALMRLFLEYG